MCHDLECDYFLLCTHLQLAHMLAAQIQLGCKNSVILMKTHVHCTVTDFAVTD